MEPRGSCRIHKGSPIIPILGRINPISRIDTYFFKFPSNIVVHLRFSLPKGLFPLDLPVKILKALVPYSIMVKWLAHFNLLNLITLTILDERYNYEVPHCGDFSTLALRTIGLLISTFLMRPVTSQSSSYPVVFTWLVVPRSRSIPYLKLWKWNFTFWHLNMWPTVRYHVLVLKR